MSERNKSKGLLEKYKVERTDGKPLKGGAIVLEWGDPNARVAIEAFAAQVDKAGYHLLAIDLRQRLMEYKT